MAKLYVNPKRQLGHINPELQGHFSEHLGRCIYEGVYVGENSDIPNTNGMRNDVVEALKEMQIPVLRWPGGCFADEYHWRDGIGPKESRKKMINTHWGGVVEDNSFGTHEFMELCRQLGCKTYVNGNVGSGTVQEMSEWVEYMTFEGVSPMADLRAANGHPESWKVDYFGVGNENWGCGGNMTPEYYGNLYRRYQTYVRNYRKGEEIFKVCCGPNSDDYRWTENVLKTTFDHAEYSHGFMNGLSLHYYTVPRDSWEDKGSALDFDEDTYYVTLNKTLRMEKLIKGHGAIMDRFDPEKKIGLIVDEWGTWYNVEPGTNPGFLYQQNTMRDALVAGINLNIFNKNCDRVKMANIAQLVNVLQSVILTEGDKMIKTPTYHVFNMYKCHQDAELLESYVETQEIGGERSKVPNLQESVSLGKDGRIHVTLNNLSVTESYDIDAIFTETQIKGVEGTILTGEMHAHNSFEEPTAVQTEGFDKVEISGQGLKFTIPACSVLHLAIEI
ncbi:MAG: alpha-N-arabinofuranosidase [bacterium]|nr:alpha-N-arabinofuranosidase [bacterium]MCM1374769.1 alpha-N-arabinofuranosidase [Muribaculum sp.]